MDHAESELHPEFFRQKLARLAAECEVYQQELFETERYSAWLAMERQKLIDRCQDLEDRCRQIEASFVQSTSWRVTAPMRALSRLLKNS